MSLIHWDKSVLSFHLKEIIEDGHENHPIALAGLSAIAVTSLLVPAVTKLGKPFLKTAIKNSLFLYRESTALPVNYSSTELTKIWQQAAIASQNNGDRASSKQLTDQLS
ncbi:MAG: hypothetical protein QNJ72_15230 [Pleurocapsa sp. MO_226.B13]|nr:hypothetical protein [Pleurocapsa sp. MO_226.B13]